MFFSMYSQIYFSIWTLGFVWFNPWFNPFFLTFPEYRVEQNLVKGFQELGAQPRTTTKDLKHLILADWNKKQLFLTH